MSTLGMALRRLQGAKPANKAQIERINADLKEGVEPKQPYAEIRQQLITHACAQKGSINLPGFGCRRRRF
ncbi:hypothetical protein OEZ86_007503 [Tetradesmus obliquus]|nr:hypothetical protein OEZ86_007503 [Tetradesmus obliquus]